MRRKSSKLKMRLGLMDLRERLMAGYAGRMASGTRKLLIMERLQIPYVRFPPAESPETKTRSNVRPN